MKVTQLCLSSSSSSLSAHFVLSFISIEKVKVTQSCLSLCDPIDPSRLLCPWNSPGQNIRVGSCSLLQGTFPTQGSNPGLPHCRRILYHLSHQGSPSFSQILSKTLMTFIHIARPYRLAPLEEVGHSSSIIRCELHVVMSFQRVKYGKFYSREIW